MAGSFKNVFSAVGKRKTPAGTVIESTPSVSTSNGVEAQVSNQSAITTEAAPTTFKDTMQGALVKGGVSLATSAIMNALNKPKDAEKEYIRARVDAQNRASAGAEAMAKRKREGGFKSTISKNTKVGGSSLAE